MQRQLCIEVRNERFRLLVDDDFVLPQQQCPEEEQLDPHHVSDTMYNVVELCWVTRQRTCSIKGYL